MIEKIETIDDLQEMLWSFAGHRAITVAGRAGVLGVLSEGFATTREVADRLDLDPLAVDKVVRALTALGLCESSGDRFRVTEALSPYFADGPKNLTPFLDHSHSLYERWGENLEAWLRGEPWKTKKRGPDGICDFGRAMEAMGVNVADGVADAIRTEGAARLLDVGGGLGQYAKAFLKLNPEMKATILDIPEVAKLGEKRARKTEFEGRLSFLAGDYLKDDWGRDFDVVLIANVLHQESKERAAEMIEKGALALRVGGTLAVVDFSIDDDRREHITGTLFAINMRSFGDTHTEPSISGWMARAGLERVERRDLNRLRWLIVGSKPS